MWSNVDWASAHIKKKHHDVTIEEAWEVAFESDGRSLLSPDQLHFPPYRRYWKIGKTITGKTLLVAWEVWRAEKNLISAYPPSESQVRAYEAKTKK